jgi:hypothetical protein
MILRINGDPYYRLAICVAEIRPQEFIILRNNKRVSIDMLESMQSDYLQV